MSRIEKITIKIKNAKVKKIEKICSYFSQDYTAIETSLKLGISRQTVNSYYKKFRDKLNEEFLFIDNVIIDELFKQNKLNIQHINIYKQDIFFVNYQDKILILDYNKSLPKELNQFILESLKEPLKNHKKANCARVLLSERNQTFLISGFLKKDDKFQYFLENRLKQFRGINKERLFFYLKESQIRYNSSPENIYQKIIFSFQ